MGINCPNVFLDNIQCLLGYYVYVYIIVKSSYGGDSFIDLHNGGSHGGDTSCKKHVINSK